MISTSEIKEELKFYDKIRHEMILTLKKLPRGPIYYKKEHGLRRPYTQKNGKFVYLNRSKLELIRGLTKRKEIERALKLLDGNIQILEKVADKFTDFHLLMPGNFDEDFEGKDDSQYARILDSWGDKERPFNKRHITSDGTAVRSKSELILYEYFKSYNLEFRYEQPTFIDGNAWRTDFTLFRQFDRKEIKWEHFGLMDDPSYRENALNKIYSYAANGYLPFDNFVATYDFGDGNIDMTQVRRILVMMRLISDDAAD